jgi:hypothetical protein
MSLPFQWDHRLYARTRNYGCELLCTMAIPQESLRKYLPVEQYETVIQRIINEGAYDPNDGSVPEETSPWRIGRAVSHALGYSGRSLLQVGSIEYGSVTFWDWLAHQQFDYAIKRGFLYTGSRHSILLNRWLEPIYDPMRDTAFEEVTGIYLYAYGTTEEMGNRTKSSSTDK